MVDGRRHPLSGREPPGAPAEHVLKGLEERTISGLAAMDILEAIVREKEAAFATARDSTLAERAFGVYWTLKYDAAARVSAMEFAEETQALVDRFPNDGSRLHCTIHC